MKRIDELGISPWPWRINQNDWFWNIMSANRHGIADINKSIFESREPNARLLAAAPELYEALYDIVDYCESNHLVPSEKFAPVLEKSKATLVKAAGENEAKE